MNKVLIITYYWPPAGGAGVQRVLKFAKYLPEFGWEPVILTVEKPDAPIYDDSLFNDISKECKVYRSKGFEPFDLYKKFTGKKGENIPGDVLLKKDITFKEKLSKWIRANIFIPDAKIGWLPKAVKRGMEIIEKEKIDIIFSSAPPPTTAMIGRAIAEKSGLPWVSDFRDPWLEIVYYQNLKRSKLTVAIDSVLEKRALKKADAVTTVSNNLAELFNLKVPAEKYYVIPNGYDESDFHEIQAGKNEKFTIAYTGALSKDRVPYPLLSALQKAKVNGLKIQLHFAGRFCPEFLDEIEKRKIKDLFVISGFVPHSESTKILQTADALLLVVDNVPENKGFLTGKLFEYLGSRKPVYAIGPVDGDANEIITEADAGKMVDYKDDKGAYNLLKEYYDNWKSGISRFKFKVEKYSRKNLTKELASIFEEKI